MKSHLQPYDPPYESPIEEMFAWSLGKYIKPDTSLFKQVEVSTICGKFRLDFVAATSSGYKVAYECDGADFHDEVRDEWRDAMILGAGHVDAIVRLRGKDIFHRVNDLLYVTSCWDPQIYSERGSTNLRRLASSNALDFDPSDDANIGMITYREESKGVSSPLYIRLLRRSRLVPLGQREYWQAAFLFAQNAGGGNLDEVIANYRRQHTAF